MTIPDLVPATFPADVNSVEDLSRRRFLKVSGTAALGAVITGGAVINDGCAKSVVFYVATVTGSLEALKPLLPNLSPQIDKAIAIARTFSDAYQSGKFANAAAVYANLVSVVDQIIRAAGVMSPEVTRIIALGGVALRFIGAVLADQAEEPAVASIAASMNSPEQQQQKATIKRMADPHVFEMVHALVKP